MNLPFRKNEHTSVALKMAIPSMVESFFVTFAGLVDSLMVSSLGHEAVAAVGLTTQPKFLGLSIFVAINVSVSALIARRFGQKDRKSANGILITSFSIVLALALLISVCFVTQASSIIKFCGSTPETHDMAVLYLQIIMGGIIFNCIQLCINAAQRGAGNTKITMRTNVVSNTINIIFNYLLIGGKFGFPALGIRGAALATVLGTVVSCIMSIISVLNRNCFVSFTYIFAERIKPTLSSLTNIIKIGYSVFFEQVLLRIGFMSTAIMAANQGTYAMAAHQVGMNMMGLSFGFGDGLQVAAVALIGRSLGERKPDMAKAYGSACQKIGSVITVIVAAVYFLGAEWLMRLFFEEPEIVEIGKKLIYIMIFVVLFQIRQIIYMGSLRGAGDTFYTAAVASVSTTVVRTGVSYICGYMLGGGIVGIWFGILGDQIVRFICAFTRFKAGKWVNIKI